MDTRKKKMTTKSDLQEALQVAELNVATLEDELGSWYEILETARAKRNELRSTNKDDLGVAGSVAVDSQLQLLEDIFGKGQDSVLQTV